MYNFYNELSKLNVNEILILHIAKKKHRKLIHNYFDEYYPNISQAGLRCDSLPSDKDETWGKCGYCEFKFVPMTYHHGSEKNNINEYYSGTCPECQGDAGFDGNFDDCHRLVIRTLKQRNVIAVGDYFKHYRKSKYQHDPVDLAEVKKIFEQTKFLKVVAPSGTRKRSAVSKHVDNLVQKIDGCFFNLENK